MLHGAMFGAIADIAMGHNIGLVLVSHLDLKQATEKYARGAPGAPIATVSLSVDFAGTARKGDWVEAHVDVQRVGGTLAYANAYLHCGESRIGRASGVFRILNKRS